MKQGQNFDTIWRERFSPHLIQIPQELYKEFLPLVDVIPLAIYDENVIVIDDQFQKTIGDSFRRICEAAKHFPPFIFTPNMKQLIDQLGPILSGAQKEIHVFSNQRLVKSFPVDLEVLEDCRKIQLAILERLLLFEDMQNIISEDDVDLFVQRTFQAPIDLDHRFIKGNKVDAVITLASRCIEQGKQVVVFVRNIPVCEALFQILISEGFRVDFIHGDVDTSIRKTRISNFKDYKTNILIVTRQLYGRGFDLPQADAAIFYSPKNNERVMWQEMLRIRSTFETPKEVFILYYAWTAEENKLLRLLNKMVETGAQWFGDHYRWAYSETELPPSEANEKDRKTRRSTKQPEKRSVTEEFIQSLKNDFESLLQHSYMDILKTLNNLADKVGMTKIWPQELVRILVADLSDTIGRLASVNKFDSNRILLVLAKVLHPDKHPNATRAEKQFWHELFIALDIK